MARFRSWRITVGVLIAVLVLGGGWYWYFVLRPAVEAKHALQLAAATEVGKTTGQQFREMATKYGVHLNEVSEILATEQRNHALERLRLAPQTIISINAHITEGVVNLMEVRAWVGDYREYANIQIHEFDTLNTGCGAVPECIKPYSSTMLTSVFFVPNTPLARREQLLSLNYWCLAKIGGCKSSRDFFPVAWENQHP